MNCGKKPELLLPAGTFRRLQIAALYGADAVYCGMPGMSLRSGSELSRDELAAGAKLLHDAGKKIYVALNLFSRNSDFDKLPEAAAFLREIAPDGIIVADPAILVFMRDAAPEIPLHVSTQANVSSWATAKFWRGLGAELCVLAREISFAEACEIRERVPDLRLEIFVHGAMCVSISGRCLLSAFMANRSANRGKCAQPCRWEYDVYVEERKRPGEFVKIEEDSRGTYFMNSRDLCLLPELPRILASGKIDSLKIEGRNKSDYYVAQAARVYRTAIDAWFRDSAAWSPEPFMAELELMQNRGYTKGFFDGTPDDKAQNYATSVSIGGAQNVGMVVPSRDNDFVRMDVRGKIALGDEIEFLLPNEIEPMTVKISELFDGTSGMPATTISAGRPDQTALLPAKLFRNNAREIRPLIMARKRAG